MPDNETFTTPTDPRSLIDTQAIAAADAARDSTVRASHEARLAFDAATKALAAAVTRADQAASTGTDVLPAEAAVQHAELVLRAAQRRVTATGTAAADADRVHRAAVGQAYRNAAFDAVDRRVLACRDHEAALAAIEAAKANFLSATEDLLRFANLGTPLSGALDAPRYLQSEKSERQYWTAHQVDLENHRFHPGEKS